MTLQSRFKAVNPCDPSGTGTEFSEETILTETIRRYVHEDGVWLVEKGFRFKMLDDRDLFVETNSLPTGDETHWGFENIIKVESNSTDSYIERDIEYDLNGNLLTLKRYGATEGTIDDDFTYGYTGNQLTTLDTADATLTFAYDANGNCTTDELNGLNLQYNCLDLTGKVLVDNQTVAEYRWLADGTKAGVKGYNNGTLSSGFEYLGSLIYRRNADGGLQLESTGFGGGRIVVSEGSSGAVYNPLYFLTDHLGSTRVIVSHTSEVLDRSDYYPFGLKWEHPDAQASDNRWLYNGNELQTAGLPDGSNYLDYGARMYVPRIARWEIMDKQSEKYLSQSPFAYCANNPIIFVDPDGNIIRTADNISGAAKNLAMIYATPLGRVVIDEMMAGKREFTLNSQFIMRRSKYVRSNGVIRYAKDPWSNTLSSFDGGGSINSMTAMRHEMWHGYDHLRGNVSMNREKLEAQSPFLEERAVSFGNYLRSAYDLHPLRTGYQSEFQEGDFNQFKSFKSSKIDDFMELGVDEKKTNTVIVIPKKKKSLITCSAYP